MRLLPSADLDFQLREFSQSLSPWTTEHPSGASLAADQADLWKALVDAGWLLIGVPEDSGGGGADLRDLQEFAEEWGKHLLPVPLIPSILVHRWAGRPLTSGPTAFTFRAPVSAGGSIVPFSEWRGAACFSGLRGGDLVVADLPGGPVDTFAPSLPLTTSPEATKLQASFVADLRALASAEAVGIARVVLSQAVEHAKKREAYGRKIVQFQALRHLLAEMHRDVEIAKSASVWAAQGDEGDNIEPAGECLRLCQEVVSRAIQIHGGMGFTWELGLHFYLRHVLALQRLVDADL